MRQMQHISLKGFKSIQDMDLELRPMNVLVGGNGAGKSNLISFFKMLNEMMEGKLRQHISLHDSFLHFGSKATPQMEASLQFEMNDGTGTYHMKLSKISGNTMIFSEEQFDFFKKDCSSEKIIDFGTGHQESLIPKKDNQITKDFCDFLKKCRVYHFHDTSFASCIKQYCYIGDNRWLRPDAGNLAAVLYELKKLEISYHRIIGTIRQIVPFFKKFELEPSGPNGKDIILNWSHRGSDQIFGPDQLSDGTLRIISLVTLLLQPKDRLPNMIIVDEPELGLHPSTKTIIAGLFKSASHHCQVILATQCSVFLDEFDSEDVIMVEQEENSSSFKRFKEEELKDWLEDYTIGQLWEKNVLG